MAFAGRFSLLAVVAALLVSAALPALASAVSSAKGRYIVVLKDSVAKPGEVAEEHGRRHGVRRGPVYRAALNGYAAKIPAERLDEVRRDPRVKHVEPDGVVHALGTQANPPWGLDRIDQRSSALSGAYSYSTTGSGVTAYVIDTGIRITHSDFGGRAQHGADFVEPSTGGDDCDGHGTHVAGTIGGTTYGVAKGVQLRSVRVLDCQGSGYWSWVIAGIDWVTKNAAKPAVANMSLGGSPNTSVDQAVASSIAAGVTYAVAAGNEDSDACGSSPARVPAALTIGASTSSDARASFSNWGDCVDWFSPGASITSAHKDSDTATATWSGTSMAAPHTAGAAALHLEQNPGASPADVRAAIWDALSFGIVSSSKSAYNHLLYVGADDGSAAPSNTTPPSISGTAHDGQRLTGSAGTWSGSTPMSFAWQWLRCDADGLNCAVLASVTTSTHDVTSADIGSTLRVRVTVTNSAGSATATSIATAAVEAAPPLNTALPQLTATTYEVGAQVSATPGSWTGTAHISYSYQWLLCDSSGSACGVIAGATGSSYVLDEPAAGATVRARVIASNVAGRSEADSAATPVIAEVVTASSTSLTGADTESSGPVVEKSSDGGSETAADADASGAAPAPASVAAAMPKRRRLAAVEHHGLRMHFRLRNAKRLHVRVVLPGRRARRLGLSRGRRALVARLDRNVSGQRDVRVAVHLTRQFRRALRRSGGRERLRIRIAVRGADGTLARRTRALVVRP